MDGFHLPRSGLDSLSNREEAYPRQGAMDIRCQGHPDAVATLAGLSRCGCSVKRTIYAPTFDHSVKHPVDNDVLISGEISIIVFERQLSYA